MTSTIPNHHTNSEYGRVSIQDDEGSLEEANLADNSDDEVVETRPMDEDEFEDLEEQPSETSSSESSRPPSNYCCPLTLRVMEYPVCCLCGHCFEYDAITEWLVHHPMCPISRKQLSVTDLIPATSLQQRIHQWRQQHNRSSEETLSLPGHNSQTPFELMLLPQERTVLNLIKARRQDRAKEQAHAQCMRRVIFVAVFLTILAFLLAMKMGPVRVDDLW